MKFLSPLQMALMVVIGVTWLVCAALLFIEAWQLASFAGLVIIGAVGALVAMGLRATRRHARSTRISRNELERATHRLEILDSRLTERVSSAHAAVNSIHSTLNLVDDALMEKLTPHLASLSDVTARLDHRTQQTHGILEAKLPEIGNILEEVESRRQGHADMLRSRLYRLRQQVDTLGVQQNTIGERLDRLSEQHDTHRDKILYKFKKSLSPLSKAVPELTDRFEFAERRVLSALDAERQAGQERQKRIQEYLNGTRQSVDALREVMGESTQVLVGSLDQTQEALNDSISGVRGLVVSMDEAQEADRKEAQNTLQLLPERVDESQEALKHAVDEVKQLVKELEEAQRTSSENARRALSDTFQLQEELLSLTKDTRGVVSSLAEGDAQGEGELREEIRQLVESSIPRIVHRVSLVAQDETQHVEALLQSLDLLRKARAPLPPTGRWAMDAQELLRLTRFVQEKEPRLILEVGSGTSTIWLGYCAEAWGGKIVSLDHDEYFASRTRAAVAEHQLEETVDVRVAPLTPVEIDGDTYEWYALSAIEDVESVDVLIVDGPPSSAGESSRLPAVPLLRERLSDRAVVVLDDVSRTDEKEILDDWHGQLQGSVKVDLGVDHLGVLEIR